MSEDEQVQPWPAWVRYSVIAAFAVIVVVGLVLAVTSGTNAVVIRIVVAAVLIPALLVPVQLWGRRRRDERRRDRS